MKLSSMGMAGNCRGGEEGIDAKGNGVGSLEHGEILILIVILIDFCNFRSSTNQSELLYM